GKSGARSWGPIGWPVPGWRGGGSGVLKSASMLYHLVGMSFSSRTNFVWLSWLDLVAIIGLLRISIRRDPWRSALTIRKGDWPCQYTSLLDSCRRSECHCPNATPAARRRDPDAVPPDRPGPAARASRGARRRRGGVRGAVRVHRVGGGPDHPDGEPRARRVREEPGRLREGLRPPPGPGEGARDHPLARRHVRSRARRLLGLARHR